MSWFTLNDRVTTWEGIGSSLSHLKLLRLSGTDSHVDLLAFLAAAQSSGVDFLPLTWYPSFHLGHGGFAMLNQFPVNAEVSFAYKRLGESGIGDRELSEDFSSSITELAILRHRPLMRHPNVVKLHGICWEVEPKADRILPVLIMEKASLGDLFQFRNTDEGKALAVSEKIKLCIQILDALFTLHTSCVVHGDIKPQNILVFRAQDGTLTAKLSDFGCSAIGSAEIDFCHLPFSAPWTAPEWHHRDHTMATAKNMDIFSFALVVLWFLIEGPPELTDSQTALRAVIEYKRSDTLASEAYNITNGLDAAFSIKERLNDFFELTLVDKSRKRIRNIAQLIPLLNPEAQIPLMKLKGSYVSNEECHAEFSISQNFYVLLFTNYVVRKLIVEIFMRKMTSSQCVECKKRAAFELAFCYYVGFGVRSNHSVAKNIMEQSSRPFEDLEEEKDEVVDFCLYSNQTVIQLGLDGFSMIMDHVSEYRIADYDLTTVKNAYRGEILDLSNAFPDDPLVTVTLKATLANILTHTGELQEAVNLYRGLIEFLSTSNEHGPSHPSTMSSQTNLGNILSVQGKKDEAGRILRDILNKREKLNGPEHPETLESGYVLASILFQAGELKESRQILERVLEVRKRVLGETHINTLMTVNNLSCVYREQNMLQQAEEMDKENLAAKSLILGNNHYDSVTSMANLALTFARQGLLEQAESLESNVLDIRRSVLGELNPATMTAKENLASTYFLQGRLEEAAGLEVAVVYGRQQIFGNSHHLTLTALSNLLYTYVKQRSVEDSERVLATLFEKCLAAEYPDPRLRDSILENARTLYSLYDDRTDRQKVEVLTQNIYLLSQKGCCEAKEAILNEKEE